MLLILLLVIQTPKIYSSSRCGFDKNYTTGLHTIAVYTDTPGSVYVEGLQDNPGLDCPIRTRGPNNFVTYTVTGIEPLILRQM